MHITMLKEQLSRAYVHAVASRAACSMTAPTVDDDSVDAMLKSSRGGIMLHSPQIDIQIKATTRLVRNHSLSVPIKIKNYNDLRADTLAPRLLVVLAIPEAEADWISQDENELLIRRCAYWSNLRGLPSVPNRRNVTITIPRTQQFTVPTLNEMMDRIANTGDL